MGHITEERKAFHDEARREESRFHYLKCMGQALDASLLRIKMADTKDESGATLREKYMTESQDQEQQSRSLREIQKDIKENQEPNLKQMEMFTDLKKLLGAKIQTQREGRSPMSTKLPGNVETNHLVL